MNTENLIPNDARTPTERRENARKAGIASGKARRKKKEFKQVLEELLSMPAEDIEGFSNMEAVCVSMLKEAKAGNVRAASFVRDTIGQVPVSKIQQTGTLVIDWERKLVEVQEGTESAEHDAVSCKEQEKRPEDGTISIAFESDVPAVAEKKPKKKSRLLELSRQA